MDSTTGSNGEQSMVTLDLERLKRNCNGNTAIVRELIAHLRDKSGPKWIAALQQASDAGNAEKLREICHGMKGASATVFAWKISNLALEFEYLARDGELTELKSRMDEMQNVFDDLTGWVKNCPELS